MGSEKGEEFGKQAAVRLNRRSALKGLGGGGLAAGVLGASLIQKGVPAMAQEEWDGTPTAEATPVPAAEGQLPPFKYELEASAAREYPGGMVRVATKDQFPVLDGMAMYSEVINPGSLRELHWHGNANELSYCLAGQGEIGLLSPAGELVTFAITAGSITFVPLGRSHYIRNTGTDPLRLTLVFTDASPQTFDLSAMLPTVARQYLAQPFGVPADAFPDLPDRGDAFLVAGGPANDLPAPDPSPALPPHPYTVNIGQVAPEQFLGGAVYTLGPSEILELTGLTVWILQGTAGSLREPHWHPNAGELNYCVSGRAQIGLAAPNGAWEVVEVNPGDIAFIPANWFHYIASVSDEPMELLVYFSDPLPQHIDLTQTIGVFPDEIIAASFGIDPATLASLPKRGDVLLANSVDDTGESESATPTP
jgi:oxalate decarboxylase